MAAPTFDSSSPSGTHVALAAENSTQANSPTVGIATDQILPIKSGGVSSTTNVTATPTVTSGSAYAAGNTAGGLMTFTAAMLASQSGTLQSIRISCKTVQTTGIKLYLFDTNPTNSTWADKTATTTMINAADIPYLMGSYSLLNPDSGLGTHTIWCLDGIGKSFVSGGTAIYGIMTVTATPTFTSTSDLAVKLGIMVD
jgi:hypothetical protein